MTRGLSSGYFSDLTGSSELQNWLSAAYSYLGMVDYPFPANFIMPLPAYPIKEVILNIYYFLSIIR